MNQYQHTRELRNGLYADRTRFNDAYEYAVKIAMSTGSSTAVITAIHVLLTIVANDLDKMNTQQEQKRIKRRR